MAESGAGVDAIDIYGDDLNENFNQNVSLAYCLRCECCKGRHDIFFCRKILVVMVRICTMMYLPFQRALEMEMGPQ